MRLGIDIGGTKIAIGLFTDAGDLIRTDRISSVNFNIDELVNAVKSLLGDDMASCCGVGIPGTVAEDGQSILKAPNLGLPEDLGVQLSKKLGIPCRLVQDSHAAAYGEYLLGAGKGAKCLICITLGTGIGTGIVLNGQIYNGALGYAGELGHIPAAGKTEGRICGCGKLDCTEKYAAGGGLDLTANLLFGQGSAHDLFTAAEAGNQEASCAIEQATEMIGRILVGAVNLLSPDCLLFSGGLAERENFLRHTITYITKHCYSSGGKLPRMEKAALGQLSPLYGAAMIGEPRRKPMLSASIMCANFLDMQSTLTQLENAGIEYIHCDIMDNHFVPNMMLSPGFYNKIRHGTKLPFDYHIMCEKPETIIERLDIRRGDFVSIHYESTPHIQRQLQLIKHLGGRAAIALNPATPLDVLTDILDDIDMILIMSVNPGFAAQAVVPSSFSKLSRLRKMLVETGHHDIIVQVDGNCSFENLPKMYRAGGDFFVTGTSSIFSKNMTISEAAQRIAEVFKLS